MTNGQGLCLTAQQSRAAQNKQSQGFASVRLNGDIPLRVSLHHGNVEGNLFGPDFCGSP